MNNNMILIKKLQIKISDFFFLDLKQTFSVLNNKLYNVNNNAGKKKGIKLFIYIYIFFLAR